MRDVYHWEVETKFLRCWGISGCLFLISKTLKIFLNNIPQWRLRKFSWNLLNVGEIHVFYFRDEFLQTLQFVDIQLLTFREWTIFQFLRTLDQGNGDFSPVQVACIML